MANRAAEKQKQPSATAGSRWFLQETAHRSLFSPGGMITIDASVVALAQEHPAHLLLTDDLAVRITAIDLGLQVYGTIGILIDGKRDGVSLSQSGARSTHRFGFLP